MATIQSSFVYLMIVLLLSYTFSFPGYHNSRCQPACFLQKGSHSIKRYKRWNLMGGEYTTLLAKKETPNNDIKEKKYTQIDDGSPIGVAIVGLGLIVSLYFPGILTSINSFFHLENNNNTWIIILGTASTTAGLARLFRYTKDKNKDDD